MRFNKNFVCAIVLLVLFQFAFVLNANAHAIADLSKFSRTDVGLIYLKLGFTHILPLGLDHILFVLSIFFLNNQLKTIIWQATAFTVAHSITLGLAMYGFISPPTHIVEPIIALSIMFIAIENIISEQLKPSRIIIVFVFGLIHGMGFANVLTELGLPHNQIAVIILAWFLIGKWFNKKSWYRIRIVIPISAIIAIIAIYWTIERTFFAA